MNLIFIITYISWFGVELLLNRLLRSKATDRQHVDNRSLSLIWITIIVTVSIATYIAIRFYVPIFSNNAYCYIGIAVIWIGILLRLIAVVSLGRFFTVDVTIRQNHALKKDGLYRFLRHPSYFASLLSFIGFGLSLNNWISLLLITAAVVIIFSIRIKIEERVLIEQFGAEYLDYKKRTHGLIPFLF